MYQNVTNIVLLSHNIEEFGSFVFDEQVPFAGEGPEKLQESIPKPQNKTRNQNEIEVSALSEIKNSPNKRLSCYNHHRMKTSKSKSNLSELSKLKPFNFNNDGCAEVVPQFFDLKSSGQSTQNYSKASMFTKMSTKLLQKQLKGEVKVGDTFDLMTNQTKLKKVINGISVNRSQDQRVSERMYYNRRTMSHNNYQYHYNHHRNLKFDDMKSLQLVIDDTHKVLQSNPMSQVNKMRLSSGHRTSASVINNQFVSPKNDLLGAKYTPNGKSKWISETVNKENNRTSTAKSQNRQSSVKSAARSAARYNSFYHKQLSFVEHKFHKINNELRSREQSLTEMEKKRNTMSMLSKGSQRILNQRDSCIRSNKTNNESPSTVNLDLYNDDKRSVGMRSEQHTCCPNVHDSLYQEKNVLTSNRAF